MYVLVLESSTSSAKAMLYEKGRGDRSLRLLPVSSKCPGDVTNLDADIVYGCLMEAGRKAAIGHEISAVSLSSIWHSLLICDKNMAPENICLHMGECQRVEIVPRA